MTSSQIRKCGSVAVIGAPNAGKSTLVNAMVGSKVSIVSPKVQTTRNRVLGIAIHDNAQVILIDTPGLFSPQSRLDRAMVSAAWTGASEGDVIAYLFDTKKKSINANDRQTLARLTELSKELPVILVLNKVDAIDKPKLLKLATEMNALCPFRDTFMISAQTGDGVKDVLNYFAKILPEGDWIFDEDQITDMPMRLLAAEITREQVFNQLYEEIPYAITVETETWEEFDNGDVRIQQLIHVEKDQQKAIVLGKGGARLREIGSRARTELETIFDRKVHLKLFVRVTDKWKDDPLYYAQWGLSDSK
jgi:GTP-binding protein Era